MRALFALFLSIGLYADNEIYIDQTGDNAAIDIEQLGSSNLIGGLNATTGSMTAAILNGTSWTLDLNQIGASNLFLTDGIIGDNFTGTFDFIGDSNEWTISMDTDGLNATIGSVTAAILKGTSWTLDLNQIGSSNIFLTDGIIGDNFTGTFDFIGDSNEWTISMDTDGLNGADYVNLNFDITGSSNTADIDLGQDDDVSYLDLDWLFTGDSNEITLDLDSAYATNYMDILGDSNTLTFTGSGYGASSSDAAYFYLDLDGDSNTLTITQSSTLAADWLKIEADTSNSNICIVQNDGGTSTSC